MGAGHGQTIGGDRCGAARRRQGGSLGEVFLTLPFFPLFLGMFLGVARAASFPLPGAAGAALVGAGRVGLTSALPGFLVWTATGLDPGLP
ncbi:hypothetical protein [Pararhodospirillum photometricum]|nr:hypothetical protein [Pararhodospirillum photometricum]